MLAWDDLRFFHALAEEGSLAAAGRKLGVDHVTVARRVAALEASCGLKLVDRRGGRTRITSAGEKIAAHARAVQAEMFALERTLMAQQTSVSGIVSVTMPPVFVSELVMPHMAQFRLDFPDIHLRLLGDRRLLSLSQQEADIGLRLTRPDDEHLIIRKIGTMRYRIYGAPTYLAGRNLQTCDILDYEDRLYHEHQQKWLRSFVGDKDAVMSCNQVPALISAAVNGIGIAVLPELFARSRDLVEVDPECGFIERDLWLTWHEDLRDHPALSVVVRFLIDCVQRAGL